MKHKRSFCLASGLIMNVWTERTESPLLSCTFLSVSAFLFGPPITSLLLIARFGASRLCLGLHCSVHTVLRARRNHVGNLSASSTGHRRTKTDRKFKSCLCSQTNGILQHSHQSTKSWLTWRRGRIILPRGDELDIRAQGSDGAPGADAAVTGEASPE